MMAEQKVINIDIHKADTGRWVSQFFFDGKKHVFFGARPSEALAMAVEFFGEDSVLKLEVAVR